jgi:ABC-type uncharacterized transport system ATPase subunit
MTVIEISGLAKRFGPAAAVDGLSFEVGAGTVTGFLGPNGAGKPVTGLRRSFRPNAISGSTGNWPRPVLW